MKFRIFLVVSWMMVAACSPVSATPTPEEILAHLTTQDKIAQLLVPAYRRVTGGTTDDVTTLCAEVAQLLETYPFGGIILYGENLPTNDAGTLLVHQLQTAAARRGGRPQLLIMVDQEGGLVARLGHSTSGLSPMALAATGQPERTQTIGQLIGQEIKALGINTNLAPVADIPIDPHTDPIGLRAFSDSPDIVADHVAAYLTGLRAAGVLGCLKHFPGMGAASANTDDALVPVMIDRTRAQMEASDLRPYRQAIAAGLADMVMVSHGSYPQLEPETFIGRDGEIYPLPASLSPAIITGLLRGELGFNGLVMTDALLGTLITHHFEPVQVLQLMLTAGVDILPYAVELNQPSSVAAFRTALETFAAQVETDVIWQTRLDAAVRRILTFKSQHGLLTPYAQTDQQAAARAQLALQTVSNQANHATQWAVALDAVTLVDQLAGTLPLAPDERVAVLYYYSSQIRSVQYGLDQLVATGQLTPEQAAGVAIVDVHDENLVDQLADRETVVILSSVYYETELTPTSPSPYSDEIKIVLPLLETLREQGVKVIVASCHLPYDLGLYDGQADALLAGYLANGISTPLETPDNQPRFGAMVPAVVYKLYDQLADFHGRLPVNIPAVVAGAYQLDDILWPAGWGLRLTDDDPAGPSNEQPSGPDDQPPVDDQPAVDPEPHPDSSLSSRGGGCQLSSSWWLCLLVAAFIMRPSKKALS